MSIHVCECVHNGRDEYHLRYPGMSKAAAQEIADKINGGALSRKQAQPEPHSDDIAVDAMAAAMKEKLAQAREKGRGGWETCSQQDLSRLLREHVDKGDPRDVANFCAFLYALGFGIAQPEPVEPKLSIFKLLAITTAYEQGVGKGKQGTEFNPYTEGTTEREAWRLGYQEGQGMAAKGGHKC